MSTATTTTLQPIKVWGHWGAPNPWKVRIILDELSLPYDFTIHELPAAKSPEHLAVNPNGRLPTIEDPNTGVTLWESGAILMYLIDVYDKEGRISYHGGDGKDKERFECWQWVAFQISGQGPYTGQATWFQRFHPEKIPSATTRYVDETIRHISVINEGLSRNPAKSGWLVGDKCTYADLAFVTWAFIAEGLLKEVGRAEEVNAKYTRYIDWLARLKERETVKAAIKTIAEGRKAHGLPE